MVAGQDSISKQQAVNGVMYEIENLPTYCWLPICHSPLENETRSEVSAAFALRRYVQLRNTRSHSRLLHSCSSASFFTGVHTGVAGFTLPAADHSGHETTHQSALPVAASAGFTPLSFHANEHDSCNNPPSSRPIRTTCPSIRATTPRNYTSHNRKSHKPRRGERAGNTVTSHHTRVHLLPP